jgi:tetratricopeptide (TPR) repeat protein
LRDESGLEPPFILRCRGELTLRLGERDVTPKQRKGRALLAILAAEQGPLGRLRIVDLLWSNRQEEQARASLRTLLADLRGEFGPSFADLLHVERDRLALGAGVRTDLADPSLAAANGARELFGGLDHLDPELDDWLRAERARWEGAATPPVPGPATPAATRGMRGRRLAWLMVLVAALIGSAALFYQQHGRTAERTSLVLIPETPGNLWADALSEQIRDELSRWPEVQLVGAETAARLAAERLSPVDLGRRLSVDRLLSTSVGPAGTMTVKLIDTRTGAELWSLHQDDRGGARSAFGDEVIDAVRNALGAAPGKSTARQWYAGEAGVALARARRLLREDQPESALAARGLLLPAVAASPDNPLLLAALAEATMGGSDHVYAGGRLPLAEARAEARRYANRAIRIAPDGAAGYAALGASYMELAQAIPSLERAVRLEPGNAVYRMRLGRALEFADRYSEALAQQREAARLDPLSPQPLIGLVRAAVQLNQTALVRETVAAFATRDPAPSRESIQYVQAYSAFLNDDNVACVRAFEGSPAARRDRRQRNVLLFCLMALGERDRARALVSDEDSIRKEVLWGDLPALRQRVRATGPSFFQQHYDSLAASELLVRSGDGELLVDLFDQGYGSVDEFHAEGGFFTLYPGSLWRAMNQAGRTAEARQLRDMLFDNWRKIERVTGSRSGRASTARRSRSPMVSPIAPWPCSSVAIQPASSRC